VSEQLGLHTDRARAELAELFEALRVAGRNDAAYCVAHAGTYLLGDAAPEPVRRFASEYRPARPRRAITPLDEACWIRHLCHADDDPYVGKIFEAVLATVRRVRVQPLAKFGLFTREAVSPATSSVALVRALGGAAQALGVPAPRLFLRPQQQGGIAALPAEPIASLVAGGLLSGRSLEEAAFATGHHMALYRPANYVRVLYGSSVPELTALFLATRKAVSPALAVPPEVERTAAELAALLEREPAQRDLVRKVVALFLERGEPVDIARWLAGTERTALRAGLLLCGDLAVARGMVAALPGLPADAMADLTTFAMSEDYFVLRQHTGIALWPDTPSAVAAMERPLPATASASVAPPPGEGTDVDPSGLRSVEINLDEIGALPGIPPEHDTPDGVEIAASELEDAGSPSPATPPVSEHPLAEAFERHLATGTEDRAGYVAAVWVRRDGERAPARVRAHLATRNHGPERAPSGRLTAREWGEVLTEPEEYRPVGRLLGALVPVLRATRARRPEDYGFDRSETLGATDPLARAVARAAATLDVPEPLVFALDDQPALLARPPCDPPITLVNRAQARELTAGEIAFAAAEHVAWLRPERYARALAPTPTMLTTMVAAVCEAFRLGHAPEGLEPFAAQALDALGRDATALQLARELVGAIDPACLADDVQAWCAAAERSAARAALVVAFDLDAAARVLALPGTTFSSLSVDAKLAALEAFARSDAFAAVRRQLGY
jgi:hypothetical protein